MADALPLDAVLVGFRPALDDALVNTGPETTVVPLTIAGDVLLLAERPGELMQ